MDVFSMTIGTSIWDLGVDIGKSVYKRKVGRKSCHTLFMTSFEGAFLSGIDRRREQERREKQKELRSALDVPPIISKVHERLRKEVFTNPDYTVQAPEFFDVYGRETVEQDMREVLR